MLDGMDDSEQERRIAKERERRIAEFHGSYMNNTKWRELLCLVYDSGLVRRIGIKLIFTGNTPTPQGPWPMNVAAEQLFHDTWVDDFTAFGPFPYSEIEWVDFPATWPVERGRLVPPRFQTQDVGAIKDLVSTLGQFETDDADGLRVFGYR